MKCFFNLLETTEPKCIDTYSVKWLHLQGAFETLLIKNATIQYLDEHLARARRTNEEIFKTFYDYDLLKLSLLKEVRNYCSVNIQYKLKIIFADENIFYSIETYTPKSIQPLDLISKNTMQDFKFIPTNHKLCDYKKYLNVLASIDAKYWDCVRTNDKEYLEGTKTNIYFCNSKQIVTPASGDLLPGILRQILLDKNLVVESNIFIGSLGEFDGMLLSNSLVGTIPVDSLDGHQFLNSKDYARRLQGLIFS